MIQRLLHSKNSWLVCWRRPPDRCSINTTSHYILFPYATPYICYSLLVFWTVQLRPQDSPTHPARQAASLSRPVQTALASGDDPEEVIRRIADYRGDEKHRSYARYTVEKPRRKSCVTGAVCMVVAVRQKQLR